MKLSTIIIPIVLLALSACGPSSTQRPSVALTSDFKFEIRDFQTLLNNERQSRGLSQLKISNILNATAQAHANDMSSGNFFSHISSNGNSLGQRAKANGYGFCWISENISVGRNTEAATFARWMASTGHRKNMLAREPIEFGLAVAPGNYRVLVLGTPGC